MNKIAQILSTINLGLVVLDRDYTVQEWNKWMEHHSGIPEGDIVGRSVLDFYPCLGEPRHRRLLDSVFSFGNYAYFSQKLHRFLFRMDNPHGFSDVLPDMQQSCAAGPIRDAERNIVGVYISVQDVTENVYSELRLRTNVAQLQEALAKVKQLEGIIPICMYCKKIRSDEQSWQQMERYITEHSEAQFSHGICPDCFKDGRWARI